MDWLGGRGFGKLIADEQRVPLDRDWGCLMTGVLYFLCLDMIEKRSILFRSTEIRVWPEACQLCLMMMIGAVGRTHLDC